MEMEENIEGLLIKKERSVSVIEDSLNGSDRLSLSPSTSGGSTSESGGKGDKKGKICPICNYYVSCFQNYRRHLESKHGELKHNCTYCGEKFMENNKLRSHIAKKHPLTLSCNSVPNCNFQCDHPRKLKQHVLRSHQGEDVVYCSIDGCGFYAKYRNLQKHVKEMHSETNTTHALSLKQDVEEPVSKIHCAQCSKAFPTQISLKRHVARVHEKRYLEKPKANIHKCTVDGCDKSYPSPAKLLDHMYSHKDERDYDCGRCEKIFKNRSVFAEHLRKYHMISIKDVTNMLFTLKPDEQKDEAEQQEIILH